MGIFERLYRVSRSYLKSEKQRPRLKQDEPSQAYCDRETAAAPDKAGFCDSDAKYYANLELPSGAPYDEIKKSYRRLLAKYHPDKHGSDSNKELLAQTVSQRLNEAMEYFEKKHEKGELQ